MTAGLVVEALEQAGIPSVCVGTMRKPLEHLPRTLVTPHSRGRNFGEPGDALEHRRIVDRALALLHDPMPRNV